ncbi:MAG: hypothetical protein NUV92_01470 [Ignavibacteria bacterium]|jgi:hypothetical protein|nr:hypothetical protein [Ignavibacteria bacterium]MDH7527715.1 hypothetical protein [Ignavibacteria bacterium]
MKILKICLFMFLFFASISAQPSIRLIVFPELTTTDFASFATLNDLQGAPRIFCAEIYAPNQTVTMAGRIEWKKFGSSDFVEVAWFITRPFLARTLCNDDIGKVDVRIYDHRANTPLIEENIRYGKPTGEYRLTVELYDSTGQNLLSSDTKNLVFLNPSQTLTIINPRPNQSYDAGNILVEWTPISGASEYYIKASERNDPNQSLEEALQRGTPLVNNRNVGVVSSINLRDILERELRPGSEVVLQVSANVSGPAGGRRIFSEIINFKIFNPESQYYQQLVNRLNNVLNRLGQNELLQLLQSGQLDPSKIQIRNEDGTIMTFEELINFLEMNANNITRITKD